MLAQHQPLALGLVQGRADGADGQAGAVQVVLNGKATAQAQRTPLLGFVIGPGLQLGLGRVQQVQRLGTPGGCGLLARPA